MRCKQADNDGTPYGRAMPDPAGMRYWIAQAAKRRRLNAGRLLVHVGASASRDQSTIYRFEEGDAWPRDADQIISAYAHDLDISPLELWEDALELWRDDVRQTQKDPALGFLESAEQATQPPDAPDERPAPQEGAEDDQEEAQ